MDFATHRVTVRRALPVQPSTDGTSAVRAPSRSAPADSVTRTRDRAPSAPTESDRRVRADGRTRAGTLAREDDWRTNARGTFRREQRPTERSAPAPWFSQYDPTRVERAGPVACYRACRAMAAGAGVRVPENTTDRVQVATGEDAKGRVSTTRESVRRGRAAIDRELDAGRPVTVGVSAFDADYNRDKVTDHFVLITGRGVDRKGRTFYTYNDPVARTREQGTAHRFYVDPRSGNLHADGLIGHSELSMVVPGQRTSDRSRAR